MLKSGTPHSKVGVDCTTHNSCGDFPLSAPVDDPGEVAGVRDLPPNNHFDRKSSHLSRVFTKDKKLRETFGATLPMH